jgi:hypothetical protein
MQAYLSEVLALLLLQRRSFRVHPTSQTARKRSTPYYKTQSSSVIVKKLPQAFCITIAIQWFFDKTALSGHLVRFVTSPSSTSPSIVLVGEFAVLW